MVRLTIDFHEVEDEMLIKQEVVLTDTSTPGEFHFTRSLRKRLNEAAL